MDQNQLHCFHDHDISPFSQIITTSTHGFTLQRKNLRFCSNSKYSREWLENKFGKGINFFEMTMVENVCFKFSLTIAKNKEYNNIWLKCTFFNKTKILKGKFESSSTRLEVSFSKLKYLEFVDWTIGIYFMNYSPTIANKGVTPYQ